MSHIIFDEYDFLEFFESEPITIRGKEGGEFIYTYEDKISIDVSISIYEFKGEIIVSSNERICIKINLKNIKEIEYKDGSLIFFIIDKDPIKLNKYSPNLELNI